MYTASKFQAAQSRVKDTLKQATAKHIDVAVPKPNAIQRQNIALELGNPALFDGAIKRFGSEIVDRFLTDASKAEASE